MKNTSCKNCKFFLAEPDHGEHKIFQYRCFNDKNKETYGKVVNEKSEVCGYFEDHPEIRKNITEYADMSLIEAIDTILYSHSCSMYDFSLPDSVNHSTPPVYAKFFESNENLLKFQNAMMRLGLEYVNNKKFYSEKEKINDTEIGE